MDRRAAEELLGPKWPAVDVASTAALHDAGISDRLLTQGVRTGAILRLRRGAYIPAHRWNSLAPWEQDAARIDAHLAGTDGASLYCLSSAALLHGCSVWNVGPAVHVSTDYSGARASRGRDTIGHELGVSDEEIVTIERRGRRVRVTSMVRTLVDCFRFLPFEEAVVIGDSALHRGLADMPALESALDSCPQRGRRRALAVAAFLEPKTESPGESRTRTLLRTLGLPAPVAQLELRTPDGVHRADFAWIELGAGVDLRQASLVRS